MDERRRKTGTADRKTLHRALRLRAIVCGLWDTDFPLESVRYGSLSRPYFFPLERLYIMDQVRKLPALIYDAICSVMKVFYRSTSNGAKLLPQESVMREKEQ